MENVLFAGEWFSACCPPLYRLIAATLQNEGRVTLDVAEWAGWGEGGVGVTKGDLLEDPLLVFGVDGTGHV